MQQLESPFETADQAVVLSDAKQGISLGVVDYIVKPVNPNDLKRALYAASAQLETERVPVPVVEECVKYARLSCVYRLELALGCFDSNLLPGAAGFKIVIDVKRYLEAHYASRISLQMIADAVNVSKPYLSQVFRQHTGNTIWGGLIEVRMRRAKELLLTSNLRQSDIAEAVGYVDSAHFTKVFKTYYGMNATELKNRHYEKVLQGAEFTAMQ